MSWVVVAHDFSPSTQEAEVGESLSSRPAQSTEQFLCYTKKPFSEKKGEKKQKL